MAISLIMNDQWSGTPCSGGARKARHRRRNRARLRRTNIRCRDSSRDRSAGRSPLAQLPSSSMSGAAEASAWRAEHRARRSAPNVDWWHGRAGDGGPAGRGRPDTPRVQTWRARAPVPGLAPRTGRDPSPPRINNVTSRRHVTFGEDGVTPPTSGRRATALPCSLTTREPLRHLVTNSESPGRGPSDATGNRAASPSAAAALNMRAGNAGDGVRAALALAFAFVEPVGRA
jgi:hypothetical protein